MSQVVIVWLSGCISVMLLYAVTLVFSYIDEYSFKPGKKELVIYTLIMCLVNYLLIRKFGISIEYIFAALLSLYLCITAYIDKKIKMVYTVLNILFGLIGFMFLLYSCSEYSIYERLDINILIFAMVMLMSKVFNLYGAGDFEIFLVLSMYIFAIPADVYMPSEKMLAIMATSVIVQILTNIKSVDLKHMRFKEALPLAPGIFISAILWIVYN